MMMFPEDVMMLLRQCSNSVAGSTDETSSETNPTSSKTMSVIVVDNAKAHRNSVTEMAHITSSNPPPLRPYLKTIGAAKRKRIVQQKMMDRWNASTSITTPSTVTTAATDGILPHLHQQPMHHMKAQNRRIPRNSICLSPTQVPNNSESKDCTAKFHFSPKTLSSPAAATTNHAMLLCNMLYGSGAMNNNHTMGNDKDMTHPKQSLMTDSPPSDSSPRIVRRLPSDDGGMDDIHRMMMLPPEKQNEANSTSTKLFLKRYAALPRRPQRQSSQRDTNEHQESSDDAGTSQPATRTCSNHSTGNDDDADDDGPTKMIVTIPQKKLSGVDMSPRKPARRFVSNAILTPLSPLSPSSRLINDDGNDEEPSSTNTHCATTTSPYHHPLSHHKHPHHRAIRSPTMTRTTVHSSHHHHHHNNNHPRNNKNNHRTVKYLVEALTIVNLCDIENDTSRFHPDSHHIHHPTNVADDEMDHPESLKRRSHRLRLPTTASIMSSSDESTVESIPSINSNHDNHINTTNNNNPLHDDHVYTTKKNVPSTRKLSTSTRCPQAA